MIGVLVGALLTEFGDWRMIFTSTCRWQWHGDRHRQDRRPPTQQKPRWRGLDLRGAVLATASPRLRDRPRARNAGWTSLQTLLCGMAASRLRSASSSDTMRRSCASSVLPIAPSAAASSSCSRRPASFGLFRSARCTCRTSSGRPPQGWSSHSRWQRESGARSAGHIAAATECAGRSPVHSLSRRTALLAARSGETGSDVRHVLPGMLVAGLGLGVAVVSVSDCDSSHRHRLKRRRE